MIGKFLLFCLLFFISYSTQALHYEYIHTYPKNYSIFHQIYEPHIQELPLSCESSALSDILSTLLGEKVPESEVRKRLSHPFYYRQPVWKYGEKLFWGNPHKGFVGYIGKDNKGKNASQNFMTGYGVLEEPMAEVAETFGFKTVIINNTHYRDGFQERKHLTALLKQLTKGNMVMLWADWCVNPAFDDGEHRYINKARVKEDRYYNAKNTCGLGYDSERILEWYYFTPSFQVAKHQALNGQHTFYLLGWKGDINNPKFIEVWDTDTGRHLYPTEEWLRKWRKMQYRSMVIFRK